MVDCSTNRVPGRQFKTRTCGDVKSPLSCPHFEASNHAFQRWQGAKRPFVDGY